MINRRALLTDMYGIALPSVFLQHVVTKVEGYSFKAHPILLIQTTCQSLFFFFISSEMAHKAKAKQCDKVFWSESSLLKAQFHNQNVPLHTWFAGVKNDSSVNTIGGGTFRVKLVNLQAFSVAGNIWEHIKSVRSDSCGTSSALSHWYKSTQLLWQFAWVNQVVGLLGIVLCQQQSWASWDPHSLDSIQRQAGALTPTK